MKYNTLFISLFGLFMSCGNASNIENSLIKKDTLQIVESNKQMVDLEKLLTKNFYPSNVAVQDSILTIKMETPFGEFYSPDKVPIIREFSILLIKNYLNDIKGIVFINFLGDKPQKDSKVFFSRKELVELIKFNTSNKTIFDFKTYILKNINPNKVIKFSGYLEALNTIDKKTAIVTDYITLLLQYEKECEGLSQSNKYRDILIKLKGLILENKDLWPEFDKKDIDYFLDYCSTSRKS